VIFILTFKNYSLLITDKEIKECLKTLKREYKNMNMNIIVFRSKWQVLFNYLYLTFLPFTSEIFWGHWEDVKNAWKVITGGVHYGCGNIIYLFPFNYVKTYKNPKLLKLQIMHCLLHELQHAHQRIYGSEFYNNNQNKIKVGEKNYEQQPLEIDADNFASEVIKKHKKKFDEIIKYKNWNIVKEKV
jgi:hypothetical protein